MVQRSVRKEPNKERKVELIGCRRRAILWSPFVIRERENASPSPRTFALLRLPLYRYLSSSPAPLRSASSDDTLVHSRGISIFEFGGRAGSARTLAGYYENSGVPSEPPWNSIHVSRRSRQKSHDCRRSPSCRRAPGVPELPFDWDPGDPIV